MAPRCKGPVVLYKLLNYSTTIISSLQQRKKNAPFNDPVDITKDVYPSAGEVDCTCTIPTEVEDVDWIWLDIVIIPHDDPQEDNNGVSPAA